MVVAISLLRGINVGGHNKIRMADLRELYASLGLRKARTLLQSGNAVFETDEPDLSLVQARIEAGIRDRFGLEIHVLMRRSSQFRSIVDRHPFTDEQQTEAKKMALVFLSDCPAPDDVSKLRESNPGREFIHASGSELYVFYTDGQARSKLDNGRIERALGLRSTARNWNTCNRLLKLLGEVET